MADDSPALPLVPKPPAHHDLRHHCPVAPRRPQTDQTSYRRALQVLLRSCEPLSCGSAADSSSDGGFLRNPPKRSARSRGFLKDVYNISSLSELEDRQVELRNVISSNETRQRAELVRRKYESVTLLEERLILSDSETLVRSRLNEVEQRTRQAQFSLLQLLTLEFLERMRLEKQFPLASVVAEWVQIQLKHVREDETRIRFDEVIPLEHMAFMETFGRYLLEGEALRDWTTFRVLVRSQQDAEHCWLDSRREARAMVELDEFVQRDALESVLHVQYTAALSHALRELRFLQHNDVQAVEARKRTIVERREGNEFHNLARCALEERRLVSGSLQLAQLGSTEHRLRRDLARDENDEFRSILTQGLRDWHAVHSRILSITEVFKHIVDAERLRRTDVIADWRMSWAANILHPAQLHHQWAAHREWERAHLIDTYLDGRVAIWKQQECVVDEMFQAYRRETAIRFTIGWSTILAKEEEAKRGAILSDQWKVFLLFYLWSAVQRYKTIAFTQAQRIIDEEDTVRAKIRSLHETEKAMIAENREWVVLRDEDRGRAKVREEELDSRLGIWHAYRNGRDDAARAHIEVGVLLVSSVEATARKRNVLQEVHERYEVKSAALREVAMLEKKGWLAQAEATERRLVYVRIFQFVVELYRVDVECEEEQARIDLEQHRLWNEELTQRVRIQGYEEEHISVLKKMFEAKSHRLVNLLKDEMEFRLSIASEAQVAANALVTRLCCSVGLPLRFLSYTNPAVMRELRLLDMRSFVEDLQKEATEVRTVDEPAQRRWIVSAERDARNRWMLSHQEATARNRVVRQWCRGWEITQDAAYAYFGRELMRYSECNEAVIVNEAQLAANELQIDERVQLMQLLQRQEEAYRIAEEQITLRMLIEEGPLLRDYFRLTEEIVTSEELARAALKTEKDIDAIVVRAVGIPSVSNLVRGRTKPAPDTAANPEPPVLPADNFAGESREAHPVGSKPATHEVHFHSAHLSIKSHLLEGATIQLAIHRRPADHTGGENAQQDYLCDVEKLQTVVIGSKTLLVLQPVESAEPPCWPLTCSTDIAVVVLRNSEPLLSGSKRIAADGGDATDEGIVSIPLRHSKDQLAVASGSAMLIVDIK